MFAKKIRVTAALISVVILVSTLAGCGGKKSDTKKEGGTSTKSGSLSYMNSEGFPITKEKITLRGVSAKTATHNDWNKMLVFQEYEKKTNMHIEWESLDATSFLDKRNLMIASGDFPDLFMRCQFNSIDELNYGSQGIILPLNDLIKKYGPVMSGIMDKDSEIKKAMMSADGKIYSLPVISDNVESTTQKTWINKKWLDKLNLKVPTATDELYSVLKAFKTGDPNGNGKNDEIAFSAPGKSANMSTLFIEYFVGYWGFRNTNIRGTNFGANFDLDKNGKIRFMPADPKYKEMLQYLNKLWSEDLIDKDYWTMDLNKFMVKADSNVVGYAPIGVNTQSLGSKYSADYVSTPVLKGPYNDQINSNGFLKNVVGGTFVITKANKYPEATMRWVDYFYSLEGTTLLQMGVEGKTYIKLPNGEMDYTDEIKNNPNGLTLDQAIGQYTCRGGGAIPNYVTRVVDKSANQTPQNIEATNLIKGFLSKDTAYLKYSIEQMDRLNALQNDISTYLNEMIVKFITGAEPLSNWDNYVSKLKQMGLEEYIKINNDAYTRYKESK